jgi:hypothetical protein
MVGVRCAVRVEPSSGSADHVLGPFGRRPRSSSVRRASDGWPKRSGFGEFVAKSSYRENPLGFGRVALNFAPKAFDVHIKRLRVAHVMRTPHAVDEEIASEYATCVQQQNFQEFELFQGQRNELAPNVYFMA